MTIRLTSADMRAIFPRSPQPILDAFVAKQDSVLTPAGINHTRPRLKFFFANLEHESGGFSIPGLTENISYTAERMAAVWPNRFADADAVRAKYGTAPGWQARAFDDIYGDRMGNRPGTRDGSTYIGRGGPQWTGRDGYSQCERRTGLPAVSQPHSVARQDKQPEVCAAFWSWKNLNVKADVGDFVGAVRLWNGGTNGMADRQAAMRGNDPIINRMTVADDLGALIDSLEGQPPTAKPPKNVVDGATKKERGLRKAAGAGGAGGVGNETAGTVAPDKAPVSSTVAYCVIGLAVVIAIVATVLIARKRAAVLKNWR